MQPMESTETPPAELQTAAADYFKGLQDRITAALEELDGGRFRQDEWTYPNGGGGRSRVLVEGNVFEKAGVNLSNVAGEFSEEMAKSMPGDSRAFTATGVSLVLHPWNPKVPTVHANFRYLTQGSRGWFGGGADLTPYYPTLEDCVHFHRTWRDACRRHPGVADYDQYKTWCDEYFFIKHRDEPRGVGGLFFDYRDTNHLKFFDFVRDAGDSFLESYLPIVRRRKDESYAPAERDFQLYRRGRYVEFNLVYDRGTVFGLKTGGRIESILMSLPLNVKWLYDYKPTPDSPEARLTDYWLKPRDWASEPLPGEAGSDR
ncbi:MAG: oxygen-dependent coproporphyrinogen oxidase [Planctomycetia bacterium]